MMIIEVFNKEYAELTKKNMEEAGKACMIQYDYATNRIYVIVEEKK